MRTKKIEFIEVLKRWGIGEAKSEFGSVINSSEIRNGLKNNKLNYLITLLQVRYPVINDIYKNNVKWCLKPFDFILKNFDNLRVFNSIEWEYITGSSYKLDDALNYYLNLQGDNKVKKIIETMGNMEFDDFTGIILLKEKAKIFRIIEGNSRLTAIYKYHKDKYNLNFLSKIEIIVGM